ncbi:MAG: hypothetical protein LBU99_02200, partial [Spirochaetaceae bacterium]|nr:hypothetical protein [Spirochaetaceae bacterium]
MEHLSCTGFIVHAYPDPKRSCINIIGRLTDGRSFAAVCLQPKSRLYLRSRDKAAAERALTTAHLRRPPALEDSNLSSFDGSPCCVITANNRTELARLQNILTNHHIETFSPSPKGGGDYLIENNIRGGIRITGETRPGRSADLVFPAPEIVPDNS